MPLIVQYPAVVPVLIDGVVAGETNRVIDLPAGAHRISVDDADGAEPACRDLVVGAADAAPDAAPTFLNFSPLPRCVDRYSALYCCYNGFVFGQFMALSFAEYAQSGYLERRTRMQEFLDEIGAEVELPSQTVSLGSEEHALTITRMVEALAARSSAMADFARLGQALIVYGNLTASGDMGDAEAAEAATSIAADIENWRSQHRWPPISLEQFVPRVSSNGDRHIDDVLSPSLAYLASVVQGLEVEDDTAFVIMPFAPPYAGYFGNFYRPALERAGLRAFRAWGGLSNEDYCDLLLSLIAKCGLVWADVSDANPNVYYETGAAHAFGKIAVLVVHEEQAECLPANIGHDVVVRYSPARSDWPEGAIGIMAGIVLGLRAAARRGERSRITPALLNAALDKSAERLVQMLVPAEARVAAKRGFELALDEDYAAAAEAFSRAIALGLDDADVYASRARVRMFLDDFAGAAADMSHAIDRGYVEPLAIHRLRGIALSHLDDFEGAEAEFSLVLAQDVADAQAWCFRGIVRTQLGRFEAAEDDFAEASARGNDEWQLHEGRAYANLRLARPEAAALALGKALCAAPDAPATLARQADQHLADGRDAEAVAAYRQALALEPSAERHFALALALQRADQRLESDRHYELGLEIATPVQLSEAIREIEFWLPGVAACSGILEMLRARRAHHLAAPRP